MFPILAGLMFAGSPLGAQKVERLDSYEGVAIRILQSNNAGDVHAVIDPALNEVVGYIEGCARAHNIFAHPDGDLLLLLERNRTHARRLRYGHIGAGRAAPAHGSSEQGRLQQVQP